MAPTFLTIGYSNRTVEEEFVALLSEVDVISSSISGRFRELTAGAVIQADGGIMYPQRDFPMPRTE